MNKRFIRGVTVAVGVVVLSLASAPAQAVDDPDFLKLVPIDGGHWQANVGLPDSFGDADIGLVRYFDDENFVDDPDLHPEVAAVTGLEGRATSELTSFGFAVFNERAVIVPCVHVGYTDGLGMHQDVMITSRMMRPSTEPQPPGWMSYHYDGPLPPGTIEFVELGIHVDDPVGVDDPEFLVFDNVTVNEQVWTQPADNAVG